MNVDLMGYLRKKNQLMFVGKYLDHVVLDLVK
jgi:hypothetical protein